MENRIVNYNTKHISKFTPDDTIYIKKMVSGVSFVYFCHFIKYERGVVYGKLITLEPDWGRIARIAPIEVKARLKNCFLWGNSPNSNMSWSHCNWFQKNGTVIK